MICLLVVRLRQKSLQVFLEVQECPFRRAHVDVGTCPHQVLAATLTLSQPRGADYAHSILVSTPSFESHRRACRGSARLPLL